MVCQAAQVVEVVQTWEPMQLHQQVRGQGLIPFRCYCLSDGGRELVVVLLPSLQLSEAVALLGLEAPQRLLMLPLLPLFTSQF